MRRVIEASERTVPGWGLRLSLLVAIAGYYLASPVGLLAGSAAFYFVKAFPVDLLPYGSYVLLVKGVSRRELLPLLSVVYAVTLAPVALLSGGSPFYVAGDVIGLAVLVAAALVGRQLPLKEVRGVLDVVVSFGFAGWALWFLLVISGVVDAKRPAFDPLTVGIIFGYFVYGTASRRIWSAAALAVVFWFNVVESQSRTGAVAFLVFTLLSFWTLVGARGKAAALLLTALLGIAAWLWFDELTALIKDLTVVRMTIGEGGDLDVSTQTRLLEIEAELATVDRVSWLAYSTGLGPGAMFEFEGDVVHHAHVSPVILWFRFGLVGLLVWLWFTWFAATRLGLAMLGMRFGRIGYGEKPRAKACDLGPIFYAVLGASIMALPGQLVLWNPILGLLAGVAHRRDL